MRPSVLHQSHTQTESGQALTEVLVILLAMVPMVFLGVWVAKVADMQLATGAAARKIAFECTRRTQNCKNLDANSDIVDATRLHQYGAYGREVLSNDSAQDENPATAKNPLWVDHKGRALLAQFSDISGSIENENFNATASILSSQKAAGIAKSGFDLVSNLAGPGHFGFDTFGGFIKGSAQVRIASQHPGFSQSNRLDPFALTARRQVAILTDQWNASGADNGRRDSTASRVDKGKLLPLVGSASETALKAAYGLTTINMNAARGLMLEPSANKFRFHEADVSLIPPDRDAKNQAKELPKPIEAGVNGS
jgi:hypothetical protein